MRATAYGPESEGAMTPSEHLTITLTGRPPVRVVKADWPIVAEDHRYGGATGEARADADYWRLVFRQHADGRAIVYGIFSSQWANVRDVRGGELLGPNEDVPASIYRVAADLGFDAELAEGCIHDLPAEELA